MVRNVKINQTASGTLCRCAWCERRMGLFRTRRAEISTGADRLDYWLMRRLEETRRREVEQFGRRLVHEAIAHSILRGRVLLGHPLEYRL